MGRKTNSKRSRLIALFAVILAAVGALVLMPKPAMAEDTPTTGTLKITKVSTDANEEFDLSVRLIGEAAGASGVTYSIDGGQPQQMVDNALNTKIKNGTQIEISGIPLSNANNFEVKETLDSAYNTYAMYGTGASTSGVEQVFNKFEGGTLSGGVGTDAPYALLTIHNMKPAIETQVSPSTITPKAESEKAEIKDAVTAQYLVPNKEYTVMGKLYEKDETTGDPKATEASASVTAKTDDDGKLTASLSYAEFPVGKYAGKKLVAYAYVMDGNNEVAKHEDAEDADQTVTITGVAGSLSISKKVTTEEVDKKIAEAEEKISKAEENKDDAEKEKWEKIKNTRVNMKNNTLGAEFVFTVEITDASGKPLEGEYAYTGSKEGIIKNGGTVKLKDGESITIEGLPDGSKYKVSEEQNTPEERQYGSYKAAEQELSGTIGKEKTATAAFTNTQQGTLKIIKKLDVSSIEKDINDLKEFYSTTEDEKNKATDQATIDAYQILLDETQKAINEEEAKKAKAEATEFTFTVSITDSKDKAITEKRQCTAYYEDGETKELVFEDGKDVTVSVVGAETVIIYGDLNPGEKVAVTESSVDGWTADHKKLSGAFLEGGPLSATFTNTYGSSNSSGNNSGNSGSGSSTTKASTSSTKLANTADPVVDAVLIAAAGAPVALSGLALRRRK